MLQHGRHDAVADRDVQPGHRLGQLALDELDHGVAVVDVGEDGEVCLGAGQRPLQHDAERPVVVAREEGLGGLGADRLPPPPPLGVLVEAGVLDRDGRGPGEAGDQLLVLLAELAPVAVDQVEVAEDGAPDADGHRQQAAQRGRRRAGTRSSERDRRPRAAAPARVVAPGGRGPGRRACPRRPRASGAGGRPARTNRSTRPSSPSTPSAAYFAADQVTGRVHQPAQHDLQLQVRGHQRVGAATARAAGPGPGARRRPARSAGPGSPRARGAARRGR